MTITTMKGTVIQNDPGDSCSRRNLITQDRVPNQGGRKGLRKVADATEHS